MTWGSTSTTNLDCVPCDALLETEAVIVTNLLDSNSSDNSCKCKTNASFTYFVDLVSLFQITWPGSDLIPVICQCDQGFTLSDTGNSCIPV